MPRWIEAVRGVGFRFEEPTGAAVRWRLVAVLVGIVVLVLAAQNIPLARHLRSVERDRLITALERDAFTLAGRSATALEPRRRARRPGRRAGWSASTAARRMLAS